jgi:hypothetical protein
VRRRAVTGSGGVGNMYVTIAVFTWSNRLLTARTLDEKTVVTMLYSGPDRSASFEARSRSGVLR